MSPTSAGAFSCRSGCAACCIAPSISSPIPGMPKGKPAGLACVQLDEQRRCKIFGQPGRPAVCSQLQASPDMCGPQDDGGRFALTFLARLETLTRPD
ncbi:YkgJ family cysteine cluster protein [Limnohabitans sp.]|uniref:YkgJ family cysteine cluster protein n=1 Tax=Limnohabitans sp. TaxID=1907725 RepID=UPI0037BF059A